MPFFGRYTQVQKESPELSPSEQYEEVLRRQNLAPGIAGSLGLSKELIRGAGLASSTHAIMWGIWVAWPLFEVFTNPFYEHYRTYPEWIWGSFALGSGMFQFVGFARHIHLLSFIGAVLLIAFYLFGTWNFLTAEDLPPNTAIFGTFTAWQILIADTKGRAAPNLITFASSLVSRQKKRTEGGPSDADNV